MDYNYFELKGKYINIFEDLGWSGVGVVPSWTLKVDEVLETRESAESRSALWIFLWATHTGISILNYKRKEIKCNHCDIKLVMDLFLCQCQY